MNELNLYKITLICMREPFTKNYPAICPDEAIKQAENSVRFALQHSVESNAPREMQLEKVEEIMKDPEVFKIVSVEKLSSEGRADE